MTGHGAKLGPKREQAILALLETGSVEQAAEQVGIGGATLTRWLKQKEFQLQYHAARHHVFQMGLAKLSSLTGTAIETLETVMVDPLARSASKVAAARTLLDIATRTIQANDADAQLMALETTKPKPDLSQLTDEEFLLFRRLHQKLSGGGQTTGPIGS
jgi:transposase-like protein